MKRFAFRVLCCALALTFCLLPARGNVFFPIPPIFDTGGAPPAITPATVTYTDQKNFTAGGADPHTFTSVNFGTAASSRRVIVFLEERVGGAGIVGVTIGGVTATLVAEVASDGTDHAVMYIAAVPTGTSGDVVVDRSTTGGTMGMFVWAAYNLLTSTPTDTATFSTGSSDISLTGLDVPASGILIAGGYTGSSTTAAWTTATESSAELNYDGSKTITGATREDASAQSGLTVTCDFGSPGGVVRGIAAAFR